MIYRDTFERARHSKLQFIYIISQDIGVESFTLDPRIKSIVDDARNGERRETMSDVMLIVTFDTSRASCITSFRDTIRFNIEI